MVSSIGRVIENLEEFDLAAAFLIALGADHRERGIKMKHFDSMEAAICKTLEILNGPHFEPIVQGSWHPLFQIMAKKMLQENYDHNSDLEFIRDQRMGDKLG